MKSRPSSRVELDGRDRATPETHLGSVTLRRHGFYKHNEQLRLRPTFNSVGGKVTVQTDLLLPRNGPAHEPAAFTMRALDPR